jgi:predicted amidohydrolase YtcJ
MLVNKADSMLADIVLINGNVITLNPSKPIAQAVAISDGHIVAVGSNGEVRQWISKTTKIVKLRGKTLIPGFTDTHVHMAEFGFSLSRIDFRGVKSIRSMQKLLQEKVQKMPKGKWILGRGWDQECFKEKRYPTRWDLDKVSLDNPVAFSRVCGHVGVVNSKALEIASISENSSAPSDGQIDRDPKSGEPTGILKEAAYDLVLSSVPEPSENELTKACVLACEKAVETGLTSVHWIVGNAMEIRVLQRLKKQGKLPLRVYLIVPAALLRFYARAGLCTGFGDDMLRLGGVKIFVDGSLGGRTAALEKPYSDAATKGMLCLSEKDLAKIVKDAQRAGFQACVHAIGDKAINTALNAFKSAAVGSSGNPWRHRIEHASVLNKQLIKRLKSLGVIASVQPHFVVSDFWVESRLGSARARWTYPFRTLVENDVLITGSSDCPVEPINPLLGVFALVARESFPEERVSVEEALRVYTFNAAYASFEESVKGSVETGKLADFTVLSQNPLTVSPKKVKDIQVEMTIVGGKTVFLREG